jgi:hypothetical protein
VKAVDIALIEEFERELDPTHPERSKIPSQVLGYGEMSTVLRIGTDEKDGRAYKRMAMFESPQEAQDYKALYEKYAGHLSQQIGINVVPGEVVAVPGRYGPVVVYLVQPRLPADAIAHRLMRNASEHQAMALFSAILRESAKLFRFNAREGGEITLALDAQVSNWVVTNYDPTSLDWSERIELGYFDTGTPLLRVNGVEQLQAELFLRSAPSFLSWILRLFFLDDVLNRYYDFRLVCIDILANLYKEQRSDLVPKLVGEANRFFEQEFPCGRADPFTVRAVATYYRQDKWIWILYLAFRRIDRQLHRLLGKSYPYILPGRTER